MRQRIYVPLNKDEVSALLSIATASCRHPGEQARFILRQELQRRGLLPIEPAESLIEQGEQTKYASAK